MSTMAFGAEDFAPALDDYGRARLVSLLETVARGENEGGNNVKVE